MDFENAFTNENADDIVMVERMEMIKKIAGIVRFHGEAKEYVSLFRIESVFFLIDSDFLSL